MRANLRVLWLGPVLFLLFAPIVFFAESFSGKCVGVIDGDTIRVMRDGRAVKIRLEGIDCPERGQDFSNIAKKFTSSLVFGEIVSIQIKEFDHYGRIVGRVSIRSKDLSLELVKAGLAWHYKKYSSDTRLAQAEQQARTGGKGLWVLPDPSPPWKYRTPSTTERLSVIARELHGNIRSKVFHASSCTYYSCKNCIQLFHSRGEAIAAGYRPCKRCKP